MAGLTSEAFASGRRLWLEHISTLILNSTASRIFTDNRLAPVEQAMLVVHAGIGHVYGVAEADSCIEQVLSPEQVEALVSSYWRDGRLDPRLARFIPFLWPSLYRLGRDTGAFSDELLQDLFHSQLGRRLQRETDKDLHPEAVDSQILKHIEERQLKPSGIDVGDLSLECEGSHLGFVDALLEAGVPLAMQLVTLLEIQACFLDDERAETELAALQKAGELHEIFRSMRSGWPGPSPQNVPNWVRDVTLNVGARMFHASTGHVPGWLIVAESDDELQAIHHWSYAPTFGFGQDALGNPVLTIQLTFPSDQQTADAWWIYPLDDLRSVTHLRTLLAIGLVRLDVYKISRAGRLEFVFAFGCPLPLPLRDACWQFLSENSIPTSEILLFHPLTSRDELARMTLAERSVYDGLSRGVHALHAEPSSPLGAAYRRHLETLDAATAAAFGGIPADGVYQESRESWRIALGQAGPPPKELIDLTPLGSGRGYAQFQVKLDGVTQLIAHVAFLDDSNELVTKTVEFDGRLSIEWDLDRQAAALAAGLSDFGQVLASGVTKLVVCPATAAYNLPIHDALLRLGFDEVGYTHRVGTLAAQSREGAAAATIIGFAGEGPRQINAVDTELTIVSHLYSAYELRTLSGALPRIVHLAGHGHAGNRSYETAIEVSATEPPLSSARILLALDASKSDLVFLSACSSGAGEYFSDQLAEAIPMDVAFIEAGAKAVVSTSTPVNDHIACFFAAVFHTEVLSGGSVWESFLKAREAARTATLPGASEAIARLWPTWFADVSAAIDVNPDHWLSYRLSGRYWG